MDQTQQFTVIAILALVLYFYYNYCENALHQSLLSGFWEANREFCDEAGLDVFCMFLSENYSYSNVRSCYVLAQKDGDFVINEPCDVQINPIRYRGLNAASDFAIKFKGMSGASDVFPADQTMKFYPICGKFVLYNGDTITAAMYKNAYRTELNFIKNERYDVVEDPAELL